MSSVGKQLENDVNDELPVEKLRAGQTSSMLRMRKVTQSNQSTCACQQQAI